MFKVQSLFPERSPQKQASIQTDTVFPHLPTYRKRQIIHLDKKQPCFQKTAFTYKSTPSNDCGLSSCSTPNRQLHNKPQSIFKVRSREKEQKENIIKSIETKNFKFLKLEERTLHIAISNYIQGCLCSREETKLLAKKVKLPYFKGHKISLISRKKADKAMNLPEVDQLQAEIKQIIDIVKQIYQRKKKQDQNTSVMMKNLILTVKRIVSQKRYQSLEDSQETEDCLTKHYLQRYVEEIERQKKVSKYGQKSFLLRFYQQIYDRYERNPFTALQQEASDCKQNVSSKRQLAEQSPPVIKASQSRKKATVNESFIKMRFYNNFRKQVEHLSENTQKILNEQMNRLNHV